MFFGAVIIGSLAGYAAAALAVALDLPLALILSLPSAIGLGVTLVCLSSLVWMRDRYL